MEVEWDGDNNVEYMREQAKRAMVESASENIGKEPKERVVERRDKSCS